MDILNVVFTSISSLVVLFILAKLMGNKQISQLSVFDYIIGISIGSIAAEMATNLENPILPLTAMIVYGVSDYLITIITLKSLKLRKFFSGKTNILFDNGKLYKKNLKKARLDLSDFLSLCRNGGYFDINTLQSAVLEHNGTVSFLPKSGDKYITPKDMNLNIKQDYLISNIIMDRKIIYKNLHNSGKDIDWLMKKLNEQGYTNIDNVFLAVLDSNECFSVFPIINNLASLDYFE